MRSLLTPWRERPRVQVRRGESVLAWATDTTGGVVAGTRDALYLPVAGGGTDRIPWEQVEAADWDRDISVLRVSEVGTWGLERSAYTVTIDEPGRLLELVRERVTASIVLQWHVPVRGRRGVRVIARRAPHARAEMAWFFEYDEGVDPADPDVRAAAEDALAAARGEVELG